MWYRECDSVRSSRERFRRLEWKPLCWDDVSFASFCGMVLGFNAADTWTPCVCSRSMRVCDSSEFQFLRGKALLAACPLTAFSFFCVGLRAHWVHDGQEPAQMLFLGSEQEVRQHLPLPQELLPLSIAYPVCSQTSCSGWHIAVCLLLHLPLGSKAGWKPLKSVISPSHAQQFLVHNVGCFGLNFSLSLCVEVLWQENQNWRLSSLSKVCSLSKVRSY